MKIWKTGSGLAFNGVTIPNMVSLLRVGKSTIEQNKEPQGQFESRMAGKTTQELVGTPNYWACCPRRTETRIDPVHAGQQRPYPNIYQMVVDIKKAKKKLDEEEEEIEPKASQETE